MKGILLVDKPAGNTSHDVVDHIRSVSGIRRVGHTGTLDPGATGLLILCLGPATRLSEHLTNMDKVYEGDMRLGVVTDSYDMDGAVLEEHPVADITLQAVQAVFDRFTGDIMQVPPMVSAVKVGGERLYKLARKGQTVEREARPVTVREFTALDYEPPLVRFRARCTRGTYVRSLCHEAGSELGCGASVASLRRTAVGKHSIENALPMEAFDSKAVIEERLLPLGEALDIPEVFVRPRGRKLLASGAMLHRKDLIDDCPVHEGWVQVKSDDGELLALAQVQNGPLEKGLLPRRVFIQPK